MSGVYDNWERLVRATLRREDLLLSGLEPPSPSELSLASSFSSSFSSFSFSSFPRQHSSFNFSSFLAGDSFTYHQILLATGNLSKANIIKSGHSGDLFYGVLEGGVQVVVKKINLSSVEREQNYCISELETLHKLSHSRIVPFLGHCLENLNDKFFVYKYMPKKDLSSYLHSKNVSEDDHGQLQSLDWITRLKIAIGAAEALCYLHHHCVPPIVHGYPKSTPSQFLITSINACLMPTPDVHTFFLFVLTCHAPIF